MSAGTHALGQAWGSLSAEMKDFIKLQLRLAIIDLMRGRPQDTIRRTVALWVPRLAPAAEELATHGMDRGHLREAIRELVRSAPLAPESIERRKGMTLPQVRDFHRRQQARGFVPGRNRAVRGGRIRESEAEMEASAAELEAEQFFGWPSGGIPGIARAFWRRWQGQIGIAKRAFQEQRYGCWCGPGNQCQTTVDSLDRCCLAHDLAYASLQVNAPGGVDMWTAEGLKRTVPADETLVSCSTAAIDDGSDYGPAARAYQQGVTGIFRTRAAAGRAARLLGL